MRITLWKNVQRPLKIAELDENFVVLEEGLKEVKRKLEEEVNQLKNKLEYGLYDLKEKCEYRDFFLSLRLEGNTLVLQYPGGKTTAELPVWKMRGVWMGAREYAHFDVVLCNNALWICNNAHYAGIHWEAQHWQCMMAVPERGARTWCMKHELHTVMPVMGQVMGVVDHQGQLSLMYGDGKTWQPIHAAPEKKDPPKPPEEENHTTAPDYTLHGDAYL